MMTKFSTSDRACRVWLAALPLSALLCCLCVPAMAQVDRQDDPYVKVEFGAFIVSHRSPQRIIPLRPDRVRFLAKVLSAPEPVRTDYLMGVLKVAGVDPLPRVSNKVFLQADDGTIQGVYLEDGAAAQVRDTAPVGRRATFFGLRAYDYAKGPAILVEKIGKADE
jgi:hypothetical protein